MSLPIPVCMFRKALTDDEMLKELQKRLKYNKKYGHMSIWPCEEHKPKCQMLTPDEAEELNKRLMAIDPDRKRNLS